MERGDIKVFTKSGNRVRLIERTDRLLHHPNGGDWAWDVERIDGVSKGKKMVCLERALVDPVTVEG